ncbi:MAG: hypothetical protein ACYTAQ_10460 [Planctomycetota bacterium]|jgi:hypothetical protein
MLRKFSSRSAVVLVAIMVSAGGRAGASTLLEADFDDKTIDAPIGTGGAAVGEPVSVSPNIIATVRAAPFATPSLEIVDNNDDPPSGFAGAARFEFIGSAEITTGVVTINAELWFDVLENYNLYVREQGTSAQSFVSIKFLASGNIDANDADGSLGIIGSYETGRVYPVSLVYDMDAGTYDVHLDGSLVVAGEPHGVVGRGVGAVLFGTAHDLNLDGRFYVDNISVVLSVVALDIKPGSCPNSFNRNSNGVLPVALVGTGAFDVTSVDISSLEISRADGVGGSAAPNEGPPGPHTVIEDVTAPFAGETCECDELLADGIMDLSMKFWANDVVEALELDDLPAGEFVELELSGTLLDGTEFAARDCIRLVPPGDMNGDGAVGVADLLGMLGTWGPCLAPPADCLADINSDGNVGVADLLALLANWGSHF